MAKFRGVVPAEVLMALQMTPQELKQKRDQLLSALEEWMEDFKGQSLRLAAPLRPQFEEAHEGVVQQVRMMLRKLRAISQLDPEVMARREAGLENEKTAMARFKSWSNEQ